MRPLKIQMHIEKDQVCFQLKYLALKLYQMRELSHVVQRFERVGAGVG